MLKERVKFLLYRNKRKLPKGIGKLGAWLQINSFKVPIPYEFADYFGAPFETLEYVHGKANGRPVYLTVSKGDPDGFIGKIQAASNLIKGVIWDYEVGDSQELAEHNMAMVHEVTKSFNIPLVMCVYRMPTDSLRENGISYERASMFCDYLMPMIYPQKYGFRSDWTLDIYLEELCASSVSIWPVTTHLTTKDPLLMSRTQLRENFKQLRLPSLMFWNVGAMSRGMWKAAKEML